MIHVWPLYYGPNKSLGSHFLVKRTLLKWPPLIKLWPDFCGLLVTGFNRFLLQYLIIWNFRNMLILRIRLIIFKKILAFIKSDTNKLYVWGTKHGTKIKWLTLCLLSLLFCTCSPKEPWWMLLYCTFDKSSLLNSRTCLFNIAKEIKLCYSET